MGVRHLWADTYVAIEPVVEFSNNVAERVLAKHPGKLFGILVYQNFLGVPIKHKPHPSLQPVIATIEQCPMHAPGTGQCWQRDAVNHIIEDWCRLSDKVIIYEYMPGFLVDGSVPMPDVSRNRVELPNWIKFGLRGMFTQSQLSIMNTGPNSYIRSKLFWNGQADVDTLLDEYYTLLFGPAADPVRAYWDALEEMMHHGTGYQHEDEIIKVVYPLEKVRQLEKYILRAESAANNETIHRRVQMIRFSYDNLMLYLRMREAEDQADFAQAEELGREILALHYRIEQVNPVFYKIGDLDRGTEQAEHMTEGWIRQNRARTECIDGTRGTLVAMLPETWKFKTDPHDEGIIYRWFRPERQTADWRNIKVTRVWEPQGLEDEQGHGYDGVAWYRINVHVPQEFAGREIKMNFGGVFGRMLIWINGRFVDYRPFKTPWWGNAYNSSFDIDVSSALEFGQENVIVIRVDNQFEWGGIFRRVFFWAPNPADLEDVSSAGQAVTTP